eukprot:8552608-Pyramimonas_sp.AAC.1
MLKSGQSHATPAKHAQNGFQDRCGRKRASNHERRDELGTAGGLVSKDKCFGGPLRAGQEFGRQASGD